MSEHDTAGTTEEADSADPPAGMLSRVRSEPRVHAAALAVAAIAGLVLAWLHWIGLVAAGALVAFVAPSVRRGLAYGFGIGLLVLVVFALSLGDAAARTPAMRPIVYVTAGSALVLPVLGSLVRAIE